MDQILIPMKVDCFVLNESVCSPKPEDAWKSAKIAPITQPNYTYLRYDKQYLANDILRHTDLHAAGRATSNPRIYDLASGKPMENRKGVYVHWMIPRPYRSSATSSDGAARAASPPSSGESSAKLNGSRAATSSTPNLLADPVVEDPNKKDPYLKTPNFPDCPTRWLIIRHTDLNTVKPQDAVTRNLVPELTGWIVESNHMQMIDDIDDSVDLQTDVSPYINPASEQTVTSGKLVDQISIDEQAEVFIGSKWPADTWTGEVPRSRVSINLGQGSNQLFADFQPHNGNVFSMVDNLYYQDGMIQQRIVEANVSYFVLGWHTDSPDLFSLKTGNRGDRLAALNMIFRDDQSSDVTNWVGSSTSARTLCHGSKYEVKWSLDQAPPIPADQYCASLMESSRLSVATTPLDSILTYIHAHAGDGDETIKTLAKNLEQIEAMLIARDDGIEPLQRALNMVGNANFKRQEGGRYLYFSDNDTQAPLATEATGIAATGEAANTPSTSNEAPSGVPGGQKVPSQDEIDVIKEFNHAFSKMDAMTRLTDKFRWDMFALWWIGVSDRGGNRSVSQLRQDITTLRARFQRMADVLEAFVLDKDSNKYKGVFPDESEDDNSNDGLKKLRDLRGKVFTKAKSGAEAPFYQPNDPTLLVAGVPSGWPHDYLKKLIVRLGSQTLGDTLMPNLPPTWSPAMEGFANRVPGDFQNTAKALFEEFYLLKSPNVSPKPSKFPPLYHDIYPVPELDGNGDASTRDSSTKNKWRDQWNNEQPFFPLYFEWEVDYYHIPYEYWRLEDTSIDQTHPSKVRYAIDRDHFKDGGSKVEGVRRLSGRSLILPQPSFSLDAKIEALYAQVPGKILDDIITVDQRKAIETALVQLPFLSSPLAGFTDHLLTRYQGTHVKSNNKGPNGEAVPIQMAIDASPRSGPDPIFTRDDLALIGGQSDVTPYGSLVQHTDNRNSVFKPVTHGQFRFTRLNVIDKFGQVVHAINPDIKAAGDYKTPCKGEYFSAQEVLNSKTDYDFIQIPPQINQPARLNASFVELHKTQTNDVYWTSLTEWENPVWGWVIINYANYGLQFFLPDGTFYREVRKGGRTGALGSTEWLPFEPPNTADSTQTDSVRQLQNLIVKLSKDADYLEAFIGVIDDSMPTLLPAPPAYASQSSVAIGRPLALVNMGWSLELATEAYKTQTLTGTNALPRKLANDDSFNDQTSDKLYDFQVKFGSREKAYDALVGYFPSKDRRTISDTGDAFDLDTFYTYYGRTPDKRFKDMDTDMYRFRPFYFNPVKLDRTLDDLAVLRAKRQYVFGALIDPFAPVHAYSSILPIKELSLPPWIVDKAFATMTTFFSIGPLFVTKPVPPANDEKQMKVTRVGESGEVTKDPELGLPVPASTLGNWNWLQPYPHTNAVGSSGSDATATAAATPASTLATEAITQPQRYYNRFKLDKIYQRMRFEDGPYSAIEGFLQLKKPTEKV